jgi:hypothetical protein
MSHALVDPIDLEAAQLAWEHGYRCFKIKISPTLRTDPEILERLPDARLRLDLNGEWTAGEFFSWWHSLHNSVRERVDLIEDPFSGPGETLPIFYGDRISNPDWPGVVFKPARCQSFLIYRQTRPAKVVFTHGLDHPLGQAAALWEAARFYRRYPSLRRVCGFSELSLEGFDWPTHGPRRQPPPGTGFGFDEALAACAWERLI